MTTRSVRILTAGAVFSIMAPAVFAAVATPQKCDIGKLKCVATLGAGLLGCHQVAEKSGDSLDAECTQDRHDKFSLPLKGCIEKLDGKPPCSANGAETLAASTDAFVLDVVSDLDPSYPTAVKDVCGAGKKKCVANLMKGLLVCEAINVKKPDATKLDVCRNKTIAKFAAPAKGCFAKLEAKAKHPCATNGDADDVLAKTTAFVASAVATIIPSPAQSPSPSPVPSPSPAQASSIDLTLGAGGGNCGSVTPGPLPAGRTINPDNVHLTCGGLLIGGGGSLNAEGLSPTGATTRYGLTDCSAGTCSVTGVADAGLAVGIDGSKAGSIVFGAPVPIPNPAAPGLSACVRSVFAADASGTLNLDTGHASLNVALSVTTWITGDFGQPCPKCSGYTGVADPAHPKTGTCDRGANRRGPCTTVNPAGLSKECLPGGTDGSFAAPAFNVDVSPLITGVASMAAAGGIFCTGDADHQQTAPGCFGGNAATCTAISATGAPAGPLTTGQAAPVTLASVFCIPRANNLIVDGPAALPGPGALALAGTFTVNP